MTNKEQENTPLTNGSHHIGFTVSKLEESANFFTSLLGWQEVARKKEYPAIFVCDEKLVITLWEVKEEPSVQFNRKRNIGLHHIALHIETEDALHQLHEKLVVNNIEIEFAPEFLNQGPAKHMMCYEPSGIRVEFIWPGK